jgi:4-amino-4-deoxy-L-arabinose transferase-like glycosyltransferase
LTDAADGSGGVLRDRRARRALSGAPRSLLALLAAVAVFAVTWALLVPPWQSPDTPSHFAYAESLAERQALPGAKDRLGASSDQSAADAAVGASRIAFYARVAQPSWSASADRAYRSSAGHLARSNGGGPNAAAVNPPLYYLYADVGYLAATGGDEFDRLYTMQIWGVTLLLLTVVAAWLLTGEVLGPQRPAQLVCAALAGFEPMDTFISTSITPDALMIPLWTLSLWLGARVITRGCRRRDALALCAVTAAAILTKATSYALVPGLLLALVLGWHRRPVDERADLRHTVGLALTALGAPVLAWVVAATALGRTAINTVHTAPGTHPKPFSIGQFISYVWQFYLPRLSSMKPFRVTVDLPLYDVWIGEGWAAFGWLDVGMASWLYPVFAGVTAVFAVAGAAVLARFRDRLRLELVAYFALTSVSLLAGLHLTEYRSLIAGDGPVLQGRYVLPLIGLFGLAPALVMTRLPVRVRGAACASLVAALMVLQVLALATVARAYYT